MVGYLHGKNETKVKYTQIQRIFPSHVSDYLAHSLFAIMAWRYVIAQNRISFNLCAYTTYAFMIELNDEWREHKKKSSCLRGVMLCKKRE